MNACEYPDTIQFFSVQDSFGEFSNFAHFPVRLDGKRWPTSEHYFQAMKFDDPALRETIRRMRAPGRAASFGRDRTRRIRRDWHSAKLGVMRRVVWAKFTQHPTLADLLLSTGDAKLVERTDDDSFWGDGRDGRGENWLGRILMETRERLREGRS